MVGVQADRIAFISTASVSVFTTLIIHRLTRYILDNKSPNSSPSPDNRVRRLLQDLTLGPELY